MRLVIQERGKIESWRMRSNHSSRNSSCPASAAEDFAETTTSHPGKICGRCRRQISLRRRLTRLRTTAQPTRRDVTSPKRVSPSSRAAVTRRKRPCTERPFRRTRANSRLSRMRAPRGKPRRSGLGVTGEMDFDTLRQKPLATTLAATAQNGSAALGFHPRAEAKLLFARALARLIGAFHSSEISGIGEYCRFFRKVNGFTTHGG